MLLGWIAGLSHCGNLLEWVLSHSWSLVEIVGSVGRRLPLDSCRARLLLLLLLLLLLMLIATFAASLRAAMMAAFASTKLSLLLALKEPMLLTLKLPLLRTLKRPLLSLKRPTECRLTRWSLAGLSILLLPYLGLWLLYRLLSFFSAAHARTCAEHRGASCTTGSFPETIGLTIGILNDHIPQLLWLP